MEAGTMTAFRNDAAEVYLVDDDRDFTHMVNTLANHVGLSVRTYCAATPFLSEFEPGGPGCLLLDYCLPGMNGLDTLIELRQRGHMLPVVFITGNSDVRLAVQAMKLGAVDYLPKPFSFSELLLAIQEATAASRRLLVNERQQREGRQTLEKLTSRERSVADRLAQGEETKSVAHALQISPKTVEYHRTRAFRKLGVQNVVEMSYFIWHGHRIPRSESTLLAQTGTT
jgi:FixJ family two-component response regulator